MTPTEEGLAGRLKIMDGTRKGHRVYQKYARE
jgi:hypothetical protein